MNPIKTISGKTAEVSEEIPSATKNASVSDQTAAKKDKDYWRDKHLEKNSERDPNKALRTKVDAAIKVNKTITFAGHVHYNLGYGDDDSGMVQIVSKAEVESKQQQYPENWETNLNIKLADPALADPKPKKISAP